MPFSQLPTEVIDFMTWDWVQIEPFFQALASRSLDEENIDEWLGDWSRLQDLISERYARLTVSTTTDTEDKIAESDYNHFLDTIYPPAQKASQSLKEKLLKSELDPAGMQNPLRRMRAEAELYSEENLPLLSEERKLAAEFNKIIGAQTVNWKNQELTLQRLRGVLETPDRDQRERAWRLGSDRQLEDRGEINRLWREFMSVRGSLARNAGCPSYLEYRWQQMLRLDYTPEDGHRFQEAIEQVVVPAATRIYEQAANRLGIRQLRPWDLDENLYPLYFPALPGYGDLNNLGKTVERIFAQLDPQLGEYFSLMSAEKLLDLGNRKGKAPGGYCTSFPVSRQPFIFMNAVGLPGDVRTLLHEAGHAFHNYERFALPYFQQRIPGLEFAEVASMAMELLTYPYLEKEQGGFYSPENANRYRKRHLEHILVFWPYMAVVDAFQHWVYQDYDMAINPANCDAKWLELWERFLPGVDWSGFEQAVMTGWQRKQHIHRYPLYYIEYGLAQLGAVQIWRCALENPSKALEDYRQALKLGGTRPLQELYQAAGAQFAFDKETLVSAVALIESKLQEYKRSCHDD